MYESLEALEPCFCHRSNGDFCLAFPVAIKHNSRATFLSGSTTALGAFGRSLSGQACAAAARRHAAIEQRLALGNGEFHFLPSSGADERK